MVILEIMFMTLEQTWTSNMFVFDPFVSDLSNKMSQTNETLVKSHANITSWRPRYRLGRPIIISLIIKDNYE